MLRLKFLKTLALCLPLLAGLLFCVFSCGWFGEKPCGDEEKEAWWDPCHYKNSCGFDVYVKKLKEGCFVLALEDYEKVPEFTKVYFVDRFMKTARLLDGKEYRLYEVIDSATDAQVKNLSLNVEGTKLRIFEAYGRCLGFSSAGNLSPNVEDNLHHYCYGGLAIEDQIISISLYRAEKR